ncbi:MAG: formylglycine-generating enzyme family protein [Magnetococcales bacterium]|nr:formylglycine-generating enzyme family protein [Magnetococcales bacterium]
MGDVKTLSATIPFSGCCGHGDLAVAYAMGGQEALEPMARLLGLIAEPFEETDSIIPPAPEFNEAPLEPNFPESSPYRVSDLPPVPFWRLEGYEALQPLEIPAETSDEPAADEEFQGAVTQPLAPRLGEWSKLAARMRALFTRTEAGRELDVERTVRRLVRGQTLERLPMRRRRRWGHEIQLILDRAERLIPYQDDLDSAALRLASLFPKQAVSWAVLMDGREEPILVDDHSGEHYAPYRYPTAGTLVAVLGDMGMLSGDPVTEGAAWERMGRDLRARGCYPVALLPIADFRLVPEWLSSWTLLPWDKGARGVPPQDDERQAWVERLLTCLAPAVRVEPGLLREIRLLLGLDAGVEADVWCHAAMLGRSRVAGTLDPEESKRLLTAFENLVQTDPELTERVIERIRHWHADLPPEVRDEELLRLNPEQLPPILRERALPLARRRIAGLVEQVETSESAQAWVRRTHARATPALYRHKDQALLAAQSRMLQIAHAGDPDPLQLPLGADLRLLPCTSDMPDTLYLTQHQNCLQIDPKVVQGSLLGSMRTSPGSYLARIRSMNGLLTIGAAQVEESTFDIDDAPFYSGGDDAPFWSGDDKTPFWKSRQSRSKGNPSFWKSGIPPSWADAWGWDDYGAWVEFVVKNVRQRMRWIKPGSFMMGSPDDELGRDSDESPQHEVTFQSGYWMCDTACTQALWQAVMGNNPSRFQFQDHPVERVSFDDAQDFFKRLEAILPGLGLGLPSEAQWEYACRAGTTTPFSFGETITTDQVNFTGKGQNLPDESIGEYRRQTVPVSSLPANPWGLFEMHGNVREWCQDTVHESYDGAPTDGSAWEDDADTGRMVRGGSWFTLARFIRAAHNEGFDSSHRIVDFGFRCARVQKNQASHQEEAEPVSARPVRLAERRTVRAEISSAVLIDLRQSPDKASWTLPESERFQVQSDCETLTFGRLVKPAWADAMGRDRYGLWTEFVVGAVRQRMRWIPPGRFMMGSPEDEVGRYDGEGPQHEVAFKSGFWMFDTACTQDLWQAVMGNNPSKFQLSNRPVEMVSFEDVQKFSEHINNKYGIGLSLPSEAQWEYACRAGTTTPFSFGPIINTAQVNFNGKFPYLPDDPKGDYRQQTIPVASLPANPWGLFEMHGNVWEWCQDSWHDDYKDAPTDGSAWEEKMDARRILRGGFWKAHARIIRSAHRRWIHMSDHGDDVGFRCILSLQHDK